MILVTTGISGAPFDRLLRVVELIETEEEVVVQHGPSQLRPPGATCLAFLPFDELNEYVESASTVITHAGAGSVLVTLTHGKRPLVVPRRPEHAEVVDDHQVVFARHLARAGLVHLAEDPDDLPPLVASRPATTFTAAERDSPLVRELSSYLHGLS
jgi:UDP-N-acetylglucosamine transferase subunit ALG13